MEITSQTIGLEKILLVSRFYFLFLETLLYFIAIDYPWKELLTHLARHHPKLFKETVLV